jgi:hypothetical protein
MKLTKICLLLFNLIYVILSKNHKKNNKYTLLSALRSRCPPVNGGLNDVCTKEFKENSTFGLGGKKCRETCAQLQDNNLTLQCLKGNSDTFQCKRQLNKKCEHHKDCAADAFCHSGFKVCKEIKNANQFELGLADDLSLFPDAPKPNFNGKYFN